MTSATEPDLRQLLVRHWGFDTLRSHQARAVDAILQSRESLVVLPTGGGKSLCYQLPALHLGRLAVVVSPLISLMKDQVDLLTGMGVPAVCLNSAQDDGERRAALNALRGGNVRLLYVSPERLALEGFQDQVANLNPAYVAVDEAHCISHWGHDFRPEYRQLKSLRARLGDVPFHAYTATATPEVRQDIISELELRTPDVIIASFDRPNLRYEVRAKQSAAEQLIDFIRDLKGGSGIVYCISRKETEAVASKLRAAGIVALEYHAGLDAETRRANQDDFRSDRAQVVVATNAFGMGIDKPDVRFVVHMGIPKSLEHYLQESGRAGRDDLPSDCLLFYSAGDAVTWRRMMDGDDQAGANGEEKLRIMERYATAAGCRRKYLLAAFGEEYPLANCSKCDRCTGEAMDPAEAKVIAQKILSCVKRVGERENATIIIRTLTGSLDKRVSERGYDKLSTFGLFSDGDRTPLREWISQLCELGYLEAVGRYEDLRVTPAGMNVLKGEESPRLAPAMQSVRVQRSARGTAPELVIPLDRQSLADTIRQWRRAKADALGKPAFVIFGDRTILDLCLQLPQSGGALRAVFGLGEAKLEQYGRELLDLIGAWCRENPSVVAMRSTQAPPKSDRRAVPTSDIKRRAYNLMLDGLPIDEVAAKCDRAASTIEGYFIDVIHEDDILELPPFLSDDEYSAILAAADASPEPNRLRPIFDALGEKVSFGKIRAALAIRKNRERAES